ncbi:MAG: endonuclease [Bacilli bacterium]|jgi:endonuclease I
MKIKQVLLSVILLSALSTVGLVSFSHYFSDSVETSTNASEGTYYDGIADTLTGSSLRSALNTLNSSKRQRTVGYKQMFTYYPYTDPDPSNSSKILGFYSGIGYSSSQMNKEHVWPKSRGGSTVDSDIHMVRPTSNSDNSARGNSYYAEGYKVNGNGQNDNEGWDPRTYNSSWPVQYRGQAARIIFYCMIANTNLDLVDNLNTKSSSQGSAYSKTMGKLSDLLKWNLENPISNTEMTRNEAIANTVVSGSVIQGNRNPFIDHPEYACKIWSNVSEGTRSVCNSYSGLSLKYQNGSSYVSVSDEMTIKTNSTLNVKAYLSNIETNAVAWSSSNESVATVSSGTVSSKNVAGNTTIKATLTSDTSKSSSFLLRVEKDTVLESISIEGTPDQVVYEQGQSFDPSGLNVIGHYDDETMSEIEVSKCSWDPNPLTEGTTFVTCNYKGKTAIVNGISIGTIIHVTGININASNVDSYLNESMKIEAVIMPENASNKRILWSSSDTSIVSIDEYGITTGLKAGSATITATTKDGGFIATCVITISESRPINIPLIVSLSIIGGVILIGGGIASFLVIKKRMIHK